MSDVLQPEPWLRGTHSDLHPALAAVLYALEQAREDLAKWTGGLTDEQIWEKPLELAPLGYHLRHIAGSVERLMMYVSGRDLTAEQLTALKEESEPGASRSELLQLLAEGLQHAEAEMRLIRPETFAQPRGVGRKKLPSTVIGLLTHIAEHTQRHVGEAIVTAKALKKIKGTTTS